MRTTKYVLSTELPFTSILYIRLVASSSVSLSVVRGSEIGRYGASLSDRIFLSMSSHISLAPSPMLANKQYNMITNEAGVAISALPK